MQLELSKDDLSIEHLMVWDFFQSPIDLLHELQIITDKNDILFSILHKFEKEYHNSILPIIIQLISH